MAKSSLPVCLSACLPYWPSFYHPVSAPCSCTLWPCTLHLSCLPILLPQLSSLSWTRRPHLGTNRRYRFLSSALVLLVCVPLFFRGFYRVRFVCIYSLGSRNVFVFLLKCWGDLKHLPAMSRILLIFSFESLRWNTSLL